MHTIRVTLSEEAQKAAILDAQWWKEGDEHYQKRPGAKEQIYHVTEQKDLERLMALPWTKISDSGLAHCEVPVTFRFSKDELKEPLGTPFKMDQYGESLDPIYCEKQPKSVSEALSFAEAVIDMATAKLDEKRLAWAEAQKEQERRDQEDKRLAQEWAARPVEERADVGGILTCVPMDSPKDYQGPLTHSGGSRYPVVILEKYCPNAYREAIAYSKKLRKDQEERKEAELRQKEKDEHDLLLVMANEEETERLEAGVLPDEERADILQRVFREVDFPTRNHLTSEDIFHDEECDGSTDINIDVKTEDLQYSKEQFKNWKELQTVLKSHPRVEAMPCETVVACTDCGEEVQTAWASLRYTVGKAVVVRHVSLD